MTLRLWARLFATVLVAGCGGDDGGADGSSGSETGSESTGEPTGGPATEIEFSEFYAAAEAAWCTWQVECRQYGVEERCANVNHMEERLSMQRLAGVGSDDPVPLAYMAEAIEVGRIWYDGEAAAKCLEFVRTRGCENNYLHVPSEAEVAGLAACEGVFRGTMGANGPCQTAGECNGAAVCGFDPMCPPDTCCVGACRVLAEPVALGEPCTFNRPCVAGSFCAQDPDTFQPTVCTAAPEVGQACPDGACAGDAWCDFDQAKPVCVAPKPPGAQCWSESECERPGYCDFQTGRCTTPADEGESCPSGGGCLRFDNYCDSTSDTCVALPGKGEGCPDFQCRGDFFCSETYGRKCVPVADEGERCGYSEINYETIPCSGDHYCDYTQEKPVCVKPGGGSLCPVPEDPLDG